MIIQRVRLIIL